MLKWQRQRSKVARAGSKISELSLESCESTIPLKVDRSSCPDVECLQEAKSSDPSRAPDPGFAFKLIVFFIFTSELALVGIVVYLFMKNLDTEARLGVVEQSVRSHEGSLQSKQFCLPCERTLDKDIEKYFVKEGIQMCCFPDIDNFISVVKTVSKCTLDDELSKANPCNDDNRFVETPPVTYNTSNPSNDTKRSDDRQAHKSCTRSPRPVIHLVSERKVLKHKGSEGNYIPKWNNKDRHQRRFRNVFSHQDGRLKILEDGHYYVYSQVYFVETFRHGAHKNRPFQVSPYQRVWQAIYKSNSLTHEEVVLRSIQTKCWSKDKDFDYYTSYIGAVLWLRAGDRLMVKASNISLVRSDPSSTFFGALLV